MSEIKEASISLARREKYWGELTSEEKIERTRMQVRNLLERFVRLENSIYSIQKNLKTHGHLDGKVVISLDNGFDGEVSSGRIGRINEDLSNVYF